MIWVKIIDDNSTMGYICLDKHFCLKSCSGHSLTYYNIGLVICSGFWTLPQRLDQTTSQKIPSDEQLVQALKAVNLGNVLDRCELDSEVEWASVLSLGEQQRLAFARLLLAQPILALMDESTSALDEENEVYFLLA